MNQSTGKTDEEVAKVMENHANCGNKKCTEQKEITKKYH